MLILLIGSEAFSVIFPKLVATNLKSFLMNFFIDVVIFHFIVIITQGISPARGVRVVSVQNNFLFHDSKV